jgi:hypothetical protein
LARFPGRSVVLARDNDQACSADQQGDDVFGFLKDLRCPNLLTNDLWDVRVFHGYFVALFTGTLWQRHNAVASRVAQRHNALAELSTK